MAVWRSMSLILSLCLTICVPCRADKSGQKPLMATEKKPNVVFILTDDQDLHMDSLSYMSHLKKQLTDYGTSFHRHYCTVALCCPSRVSLWTGKTAHNTNVTDINPPYGASGSTTASMSSKQQVLICNHRWVPQVRIARFQRSLPPALAAGCRLQYLLRREALQRADSR